MKETDKHIKTFSEFLNERKKTENQKSTKEINWQLRKSQWLDSVDRLYKIVDDVIVDNFKKSGYNVTTQKEPIQVFEEYIGKYSIDNYIIEADNLSIKFYPIGTIIIGAYGRVNMVLPKETIKIILANWGDWKVAYGYGSATKLIDFNEENIVKLFLENA